MVGVLWRATTAVESPACMFFGAIDFFFFFVGAVLSSAGVFQLLHVLKPLLCANARLCSAVCTLPTYLCMVVSDAHKNADCEWSRETNAQSRLLGVTVSYNTTV